MHDFGSILFTPLDFCTEANVSDIAETAVEKLQIPAH